MAKRNKNRRKSRWLSQAGLQALVRFGPEESGLREAERQAVGTYGSTVAGAEATRKGITKAVAYARPKVVKSYDDAGLQFARARDVAAPAIAAGPASTQAAVAAEQAGFTARLGESEANTLTEFDQRRLDAVAGAAYAKKGARETLGSDLAKLFERQQALRREKGAFITATAQQLRTAAQQRADTLANQEANRATTRRGQTLSHQDRVAARKQAAKDKAAAKKKSGLLSPDKHLEWQSDIEEMTNAAAKYVDKMPRSSVVGKLKNGRTQQTILVDKAGNPLPEGLSGPEKVAAGAHKVTLPALPSYKADLRMSAALDIAQTGHLGRETTRRLHKAGFSIQQLGLPTYGEWARKNRAMRAPGRARNKAAGGKLYGPAF